jgi:hypothetical protein
MSDEREALRQQELDQLEELVDIVHQQLAESLQEREHLQRLLAKIQEQQRRLGRNIQNDKHGTSKAAQAS